MEENMKLILLSLLSFIFISLIHSQNVNYFAVDHRVPFAINYYQQDYLHNRVKYDAQGYIHILTWNGKRFFEINNKNGYFSSFKPIAKGLPEGLQEIYYYDFDIDTAGVIHIAFTYYSRGYSLGSLDTMYMFYTNSQIDSIYYIGATTQPTPNTYSFPYFVNVNRTTDNQIVINYVHYSGTQIKWVQLVNPGSNNIHPLSRLINLPEFPGFNHTYSIYTNKNLFVNLYYFYVSWQPGYQSDSLYIRYFNLKYDMNGTNDGVINQDYIRIKGQQNNIPLMYIIGDNNNGYVQIANLYVNFNGTIYSTYFPLENSVFVLDRTNKLHVVKYLMNTSGVAYDAHYYRFDNLPVAPDLSGSSLFHDVDISYFIHKKIGFDYAMYAYRNGCIDAFSPDEATAFFNFGNYIIRQTQGNFAYRFLMSESPFFSVPNLHFVTMNNKLYFFNTRDYYKVNDTTGILPIYELREKTVEFQSDFDASSIIRVQLPGDLGISTGNNPVPPKAKVDKNNNIHLLMFKALKTVYGSYFGHWYYFKLSNDLQLQGGYRVTAENDTIGSLSFVDMDIDGNGVVHVIYFRYSNTSFSTEVVYTNNSSGSFATPVSTGLNGSLSTSNNDWIRIKVTPDGKAYIIHRNYAASAVNFVYGDLNGFTSPKRLLIAENADLYGGRNKVAFEVDNQGILHCFDISYWTNYGRDLLQYKYKVNRDSVIFIPISTGLYLNLDSPQFVLTERDKNWKIHVIGITTTAKIYYLNSSDNFQNKSLYDISDFGIFSFLNQSRVFFDNFKPFIETSKMRVYFYATFDNSLLGWIPAFTTGIEQKDYLIPDRFALYQNYPNPFNSSTRIEFEIPQKSKVNLTLYDLLGREIKKIVDGEIMPGKYTVDVDMSVYPSGVYFYRLETEKFEEIRKMMLLK